MAEPVVVPLDGSPLSEHAVPLAAHLCSSAGGELLLVRVATTPSDAIVTNASAARIAGAHLAAVVEAAKEELEQIAADIRADGLVVGTHVEAGAPAGVVLDHARAHGAGLIVMCTHRRAGLDRAIYGSVADEVLRRSEVPVLLVPPGYGLDWPSDHTPRLLVTLDGSPLAEAILPPATALADAIGGALVLMRVSHSDGSSGAVGREQAEDRAYVEGMASRLRATGRVVTIQHTVGDPVDAIVQTAARDRIDLIAMATHGRGGLARAVLGSVTASVLQRCPVPLLVIRPKDLPTGHPVS